MSTSAGLGTARRRVSVRRHARLVDYVLHDGCNARAWVQVRVDDNGVRLDRGTQLLTRVPGAEPRVPPGSSALGVALARGAAVFEMMAPATLDAAHNDIALYTWGDAECCLPRGGTRATLRDGPDVTAPGHVDSKQRREPPPVPPRRTP